MYCYFLKLYSLHIFPEPKFQNFTEIFISFQDKNNNKPIFQRKSYSKCIPENFPGGMRIFFVFL